MDHHQCWYGLVLHIIKHDNIQMCLVLQYIKKLLLPFTTEFTTITTINTMYTTTTAEAATTTLLLLLLILILGRKEMFYLTTHSTHFIYGYMASNIW